MKKVYCVISDYKGYEELLEGIYDSKEEAIKRVATDAHDCKYDNVARYMSEVKLSLVEWELNTNCAQLIKPSCDW